MNTQLIRIFGVSMLAGGMALSLSATAAEGLYSAKGLTDSSVFDASGEEVGEVEDVLLGDDMAVHSIVMESDGILGTGGRQVVVERGKFTVRPQAPEGEWDKVEYEIHVEASQDEIKQFEEYDEGWWNETRQNASKAWENTKEGAANAWESTKEATSSAWQNTKDAVDQ